MANKFDVAAAAAAAAAKGRDFTKTVKGGGGEYTPPPEGKANLRLIGYIELGKQKSTWKGQERVREKVQLVFELSGKGYEPKVTDNGDKLPLRMVVTETLTDNEKGNIVKLFKAMNYEGKATHFAQLLGGAFRGQIFHDKFTRTDGSEGVRATFKGDNGYTIGAPMIEVYDEESQETTTRKVKVADPLSELRLFIWDMPSKEMWASLFIDGEYEERKDDKGKVVAPAKSKNVIQNAIRAAVNWEGSPMHELLEGEVLESDDEDDDPKEAVKAKQAEKKAKKEKAASEDEQPAEKPKSTKKPKAAPAPAADESDPLADMPDDEIPD
jgi:hypothetical protein